MNAQPMIGKVAVVTGSSKGIGRAAAQELGRNGASVVINARSADELESTAEDLRSLGHDVTAVALNITSDNGPSDLIEQTVRRYGRIDYIVNTVAVNPYYGPLMNVDRESFSKTMMANNWTAVAVVQAAMRNGLAEDSGGAVVNVSTIGAHQYQPSLAPYCASKAALEVLTVHMANELGPLNVRVNSIAPGLVKTDMARVLWEGEYGRFEEKVLPLRRLGEPRDIASAICFLLSDDASWITGILLNVDGGRLITSLTHSPGSRL
jgi:3-oxoacyl-[acyl-carrier protein] reductase